MGYFKDKFLKEIITSPLPAIKAGGHLGQKLIQLETVEKAKLEVEKPRKKSTLEKVLGLVQRGETAPFVMKLLKNEGLEEASREYFRTTFGKELEKRTTYSDVLEEMGWKVNKNDPTFIQISDKVYRGLAGLLGDIFLDPKTYLTMGVGAAVKIKGKIAGKTAEIALSKGGSKFLQATTKVAAKEIGEELAKKGIKKTAQELTEAGFKRASKMLLAEATKKGGEKYIAFGGLKFAGQPILPSLQKTLGKGLKGMAKLSAKIPVLKKPIEWGKKAFVPFAEIKEMPEVLRGEDYIEEFGKMVKATRAESMARVTDIVQLGKEAKKTIPRKTFLGIPIGPKPKIEEILSEAVETGARTGNKVLDDIIDFAKLRHAEIATEEAKRGLFGIKKVETIFHKEGFGEIDNLVKKLQTELGNTERYVSTGIRLNNKQIKIAKSTAKDLKKSIVDLTKLQKDMTVKGVKEITVKREIPNYLRHFLTKEGKEYIGKGGDISGLAEFAKPLRVKLGAAKPRKLEGTISEINKMMASKLGGKNFFEPDFFKAFAGREVEHIKAKNMYDFFTAISRKFGRTAEYLETTAKSPLTGKLIKKEIIKPHIEEGIRFIETGVPQLKGVLVPEPIAKHLDETYKFITNEETAKGFLRLYDKLLSFWKGTVTGVWPAFHSRNFFGGAFNNWLGGVNNPLEYVRAEKIIRGTTGEITTKFGKKYTYKEIMGLADKLGATGQPGMIDTMRTVDDLIKGKKITKLPALAMEAVENRLRIPLFVNRLIKGDTPEQAAKVVFKFHFDYAPEALSAFERNVMRRLIPFYRWTRGNVPLQVAQLVKTPGKYATIAKIRREFNKLSDEQELIEEGKYMPDWMREMLLFKLPIKERNYYLQLDLPLDDLGKLPITESGTREIISMLSPILKYPVERIANRNLYFGSQIYNKNLPPEMRTYKTIENLKYLPEPIKKFFNFKEGIKRNPKTNKFEPYFEMDAIKLHAVQTFLGRFYSSYKQVLEDEAPWWSKFSRLLGGVPIREFKLEEEKEKRELESEREEKQKETYLKQRGLLPYKVKGYPVSPLLEKEKPVLPTGGGGYFKSKFGL